MAEATEQWTLKRLLDWTKEYFEKIGSESSRLDAEVLLAEALQCQRIELYTRFEEVPPADTLTQYRAWVKRRVLANRWPTLSATKSSIQLTLISRRMY